VYFYLTRAFKDRIISELRRYWADHPKYPDLADHIQGKYSFEERPQVGIVVKVAGGSNIVMAPDNYRGTTMSYLYLTKVPGYPGQFLEWVREDSIAIQKNNGIFPSTPGVYYIQVSSETEFWVDPLLNETEEEVTKISDTEYQLQRPFVPGTLRLYEMPNVWQLDENVNYTADPTTGAITLTEPLGTKNYLVADYRYAGTPRGPFEFRDNHAYVEPIPGCVLAFGRRVAVGDVMALVVQDIRRPSALEYGGRWEISVEIDVIARDPYDQEYILDYSMIWLWGVARSYLSTEGLEMNELSFGGEAEEIYDDNGDDYFYTANFSLSMEADWTIQVPLVAMIRRVAPLTAEGHRVISALPDDQLKGVYGDIQMVENLGLQVIEDPFFTGKNKTYESIQ